MPVLHGLGVELLFQPHGAVHQPAQPAAGGPPPSQEEEDTGQVRSKVWRVGSLVIMFTQAKCPLF